MADQRFFSPQGPFTVEHIAKISGASLNPDVNAAHMIKDVAALDEASTSDVSFLFNRKYVDEFKQTKAGACFIAEEFVDLAPKNTILLVSKDPYKSFALASQCFYPNAQANGLISDRAFVDPSAQIGSGTQIGPGACVMAGAVVGDNCVIEPNAVIGENVIVGDGTYIGPCATIYYAVIGKHVKVYAGARIGQPGFGFAIDPISGHVPIPQLGRVIIEDRCEIGANTCIDRGAGPDTVIGQGTFIDNLVQIGHNVKTGKNCVIVAQVGLSGSSELGDLVMMGGQSATVGHIKVGSYTKVAGQSAVMRDCPPKSELGGSPAVPINQFFRQIAYLGRAVSPKRKDDKQD